MENTFVCVWRCACVLVLVDDRNVVVVDGQLLHVRCTFVKLCEAVHIQSMLVYDASLQ